MALSRRSALIILAAIGLLLVLPLPLYGRVATSILDMGHVPAAGLVAIAILRGFRSWLPRSDTAASLSAWGITTVGFAGIEVLQGLIGRNASLQDAATNALGAAAFLLWPGGTAARRIAAVALVLAALVLPGRVLIDAFRQRTQMPVLASFEDDLEMSRWTFQEAVGTRSDTNATDGSSSLRVILEPGEYPSAGMAPYRDWREYRTLMFEIVVTGSERLPLVVKIEDDEATEDDYEDRYHKTLDLEPGPHKVFIALDDVRRGPANRELDLSRVSALAYFLDGSKATRTIYLDNVRLLKQAR